LLWRQTQAITNQLVESHLIEPTEHVQLNKESLRINAYIAHTQQLALLLKQQAEIRRRLKEITP
jgi:hypothetical protein